MNNSAKSITMIVVASAIALLTQSGCKENTLINSKVSPSTLINVFDTSLGCITHTYYDDTAVTSLYLGLPVYMGVGNMTDPFFGTMNGSTYFQVLPTTASSALYEGMIIDSAAVVLPYSGLTYGDTTDQTQTQTYQVFYVQDTLNVASTYYSYTTKQIDAARPLSAPTTVNLYHLRDSTAVNGVNYLPSLRIPLNITTLLSHLNPATALLTASATPTTDFLNTFHGICVKVADNRNTRKSFPYFQLDGDGITDYSGAGIIVYYHNSTDTFRQRYYFNPTYCAYFNNITKSYSHYPVNQLLTSAQPNDSIIALQNQPGANIDIVIPGLKSLPAGIINKAELQLALLPNYNSDAFEIPARLYPRGIGNGNYPTGVGAGLTYNIADRYPLTSTSPFLIIDGQEHDIVRGSTLVRTYTIGMPREVMACIAAKNDTLHLHISGTQDFFGAYHMVAGGGNHPDSIYRAKLFVVYSKLNK